MKLTAQLQLRPTPEQSAALLATLERVNAACNHISAVAWREQVFGQFALHRLCYADVRLTFGLAAQLTVHATAKVADAYKLDKLTPRTFRPHSAIAYDDRILSYQLDRQTVSIWTLTGREKAIPFVCGDRQRALLAHRQGQSDLLYRDGRWYLLATCDLPDPTPAEIDAYLGIDLGIVNLAVDGDGTAHSGATVKRVCDTYQHVRRRLQRTGTRSAKRRLRQRGGKESRFVRA